MIIYLGVGAVIGVFLVIIGALIVGSNSDVLGSQEQVSQFQSGGNNSCHIQVGSSIDLDDLDMENMEVTDSSSSCGRGQSIRMNNEGIRIQSGKRVIVIKKKQKE